MRYPRRGPDRTRLWIWFAVLAIALTGLVLWLAADSGGLPGDHASNARIVYGIGLAALIGAGLIHGRRVGFKGAIGATFAWLAIGALLVLGYSFRFEFQNMWQRITGELMPDRVQVEGREIAVRRAADGHFYIRAEVNGTPIRFLVDTGASSTVLDPGDAERAGFDPRRLSFTQSFRTANGTVRGAPVTLDSVTIGPVRLSNVRASVNAVPLGTSLIGVSTLQNFRSWRVEDGTLTLAY